MLYLTLILILSIKPPAADTLSSTGTARWVTSATSPMETRNCAQSLMYLTSNLTHYSNSVRIRLNSLLKNKSLSKNHSKANIKEAMINNNLNNKDNITINLLNPTEWCRTLRPTSKQWNASFLKMVLFFVSQLFIGKTCPYGTKCTFAHGDEDIRLA